MKKESKFFKNLAKNGFYIVLFLCISAIGISGYVMYIARNTAETVREELDFESSISIPFPEVPEDAAKTMMEKETPIEIEEPAAPEKKEEGKKAKENVKPLEKKKEADVETVAVEKEETVYTMALSGAITAPFSGDELVKNETFDDWRIHSGVDIKGELGGDVVSIADGKVMAVEADAMMGNTVTVEHEDGVVSIYANLGEEIKVKAGDTIKSGAVIGKVGNSALAECMEEPHLHLEVKKDGKNIDPLSLFPEGKE